MFEVPKNTLSTWKKHKEKIYENYERGLGATRVKPEKYEAVNKAIMKWLLVMRSENIPINCPMFKEKAQEFAKQLNLEDFHASDGWLEKLKNLFTFEHIHFFFYKQSKIQTITPKISNLLNNF